MKVLHVSTYDTGGAAKAALRLHQGLLNIGIDSNFLSLYSSGVECLNKHQHQYSNWEKVLEYARIKWRISNDKRNIQKINEQYRQKKLEAATLPVTNFDITEQSIYQESDIINLHWLSGYVNHLSFWKKNTKPVLWTLHDMNAFCGIYHYEGDASRNQEQLGEIDFDVKKKKEELYQRAKIHVVCPSQWLFSASSASKLFKRFPHHHIPYGLDTTVFRPRNQVEVRRRLTLPEDKKILLFVSQNISNYRKGYDLLLEALSLLNDKNSIQAVAIGNIPEDKSEDIIYLGSIRDERKMSEAYAAADAFIMPSREDNLPNVMLESLACGTPVICFPVGGMIDAIEHKFNGWLVSEMSSEGLATAIQEWINQGSSIDRRKISEKTAKQFSLYAQAIRYKELYHSLAL